MGKGNRRRQDEQLSWSRGGEGDCHPWTAAEKIGYGETKRLAGQLLRRGDIDRLRHRVGIDGLRESGRGTHPVAAFPLRRARYVAVETRHAGDDDFVAIGLIHSITKAPANRHAEATDGAK